MVSPATASLISGVTGLALVALNSTPALWLISNRLVRRKYGELSALVHLYEDRDGVATEETEKKFSDKVQKAFLRSWTDAPNAHLIHIILSAAQLVMSVAVCITYTMLPRRPDVLRNGTIVDRQYTVSLLNRYAFSWPGPLMEFARAHRGL